MKLMNVTDARKHLNRLIEEVNNNSTPVTIANSKGGNAVLMSEEDYNALHETIYLHSVRDLVESILDVNKQDQKKMKQYNPSEEWQF